MSVVDPSWVQIAKSYEGVAEIPGSKHSPVIMGWAKKLGVATLGAVYNDDETPWCGLFMAQVMTEAGYKPPRIALRASSWDLFGQHCGPTYGALIRFQREGGGHIGTVIDKRFAAGGTVEYLILGGNQKNKVCRVWIPRSRMVSARWPSGIEVNYQGIPVYNNDGSLLSRNEA